MDSQSAWLRLKPVNTAARLMRTAKFVQEQSGSYFSYDQELLSELFRFWIRLGKRQRYDMTKTLILKIFFTLLFCTVPIFTYAHTSENTILILGDSYLKGHFGIVKIIKSRIIRKNAIKVIELANIIRGKNPELKVGLICNDNICSKSVKLLNENHIEIIN